MTIHAARRDGRRDRAYAGGIVRSPMICLIFPVNLDFV